MGDENKKDKTFQIINTMIGKKHTEETKRKMSENSRWKKNR